MKSGHGSLSRKRTRRASATSTAATLSFMRLRRRAAIALEGELHVVGGDGLAVVEPRALAQHELVDEAVLGQAPRLGQARRHGVAGHRLHQRVVQRVEHHERRADPGRLGGIEPGRGERDVNGPGHLPLGRRVARRGLGGRDPEDEQRREEASKVPHGEVSFLNPLASAACKCSGCWELSSGRGADQGQASRSASGSGYNRGTTEKGGPCPGSADPSRQRGDSTSGAHAAPAWSPPVIAEGSARSPTASRVATRVALMSGASHVRLRDSRDFSGPEARNMELVGYSDLQARSAYQPPIHKQGDRWIAYVGHHGGTAAQPAHRPAAKTTARRSSTSPIRSSRSTSRTFPARRGQGRSGRRADGARVRRQRAAARRQEQGLSAAQLRQHRRTKSGTSPIRRSRAA